MKRQCGHFLLYELFLVILYFNFSNSETFQLKANFESNLDRTELNQIYSILSHIRNFKLFLDFFFRVSNVKFQIKFKTKYQIKCLKVNLKIARRFIDEI